MQKIDWKKLEDINGVVHWVNPQHVTDVHAFNGDIYVCFSGGSGILCKGDGKNSIDSIQTMLDYLSDFIPEDIEIGVDPHGSITMLRAER